MEKRTARLFCGFGTFILLLCTVEVSSAPSVITITDVMKNDKSICKTPDFLYSSNYTKSCLKQEYPSDSTVLAPDNVETFLCLGVYDTAYKICSYSSHWQNPFNSTAAFDAHIEKLLPGVGKNETVKFCNQFKDIAPMYNKTKVFLSSLMRELNSPFACHSLCFGTKEEFINPMCAILAWINGIDTDISKAAVIDDMKKETPTNDKKLHELSHAKPITDSDSNTPNKKKVVKNKSDEKNSGTNLLTAPNNSKSNLDAEKQLPSNDNSQMPLTSDSDLKRPKEENKVVQSAPPAIDANVDIPVDDKAAKGSKDNIDTANNFHEHVENAESLESKGKAKVTSSDIKTSTLSEHTQDHEGTNEENESSCNGNENCLSEADSILKTSLEAGELSQNIIPEASEQRDLPHYRNPNPEEESHFFTYFTVMSLVFIVAYIGYHNKQKVLAIVLEGRRSRNSRGRRRPSTASYRKLDCTLEEAVTSQCNANVTHVIY